MWSNIFSKKCIFFSAFSRTRASGSSLFKSLVRTAVLIVFLCICTFLSLLWTRVFISFLFKSLTRTRVLRVFWLPLFFFSTLTRTQIFSNFSFQSSSIVFSLIAFMRLMFSVFCSICVSLFKAFTRITVFSCFFFKAHFQSSFMVFFSALFQGPKFLVILLFYALH